MDERVALSNFLQFSRMYAELNVHLHKVSHAIRTVLMPMNQTTKKNKDLQLLIGAILFNGQRRWRQRNHDAVIVDDIIHQIPRVIHVTTVFVVVFITLVINKRIPTIVAVTARIVVSVMTAANAIVTVMVVVIAVVATVAVVVIAVVVIAVVVAMS